MTWQECKQIALQKLFCAGSAGSEEVKQEYLAAMPAAASEGFWRLAAARPLRRWAEFTAGPGPARLDLAGLAWDHQNTGIPETYFEGPDGRLTPLRGAAVAGGRWLCLPALPSAGRVWLAYQAKAPRLTEDTPEGWLLPLEEDACALLPLYIAGQLYKEDDLQLATYYMNEFETGLYALAPADKGVLADAFTSESGW